MTPYGDLPGVFGDSMEELLKRQLAYYPPQPVYTNTPTVRGGKRFGPQRPPSVFGNVPTASGAGLDKFSPEVAAWLENNPPQKPKPQSNLIAAIERTNRGEGFPANGRVSGFGNMLGQGLGEGAQAQIAKTQANDMRRFMPASQRRQMDTPVNRGPLFEALEGSKPGMPFGTTTDKMARAANAAADRPGNKLDISQDPKTGRWVVKGGGPYVTGPAPGPTLDEKTKRAALQRTKLKAKRGGVLMAGADDQSTLAEIQAAEAEIEKRIANKRLGLPEDSDLGGAVANANTNLTPNEAGLAAVKKLKETIAQESGVPVKHVVLTPKDREKAFDAGFRSQETLLANMEAAKRQKDLTDAQERAAKDRQGFEERLAKDQRAAAEREGDKTRKSNKKNSKKDRETQLAIAEKNKESYANTAMSGIFGKMAEGIMSNPDGSYVTDPNEILKRMESAAPIIGSIKQLVTGGGSSPQSQDAATAPQQELPQGSSSNFQFGNVPIKKDTFSFGGMEFPRPEITNERVDLAKTLVAGLLPSKAKALALKEGFSEAEADTVAEEAFKGLTPAQAKKERERMTPKTTRTQINPNKSVGGFAGALGIKVPSWPWENF